jgi:hypothetical protein
MAEGSSFLAGYIFTAVSVTVAVSVMAVVVSLAPAAWLGRRALEVRTLERGSGLASIARSMALLWVRGPAVRSMFVFAIASLLRSRRHTIQLATYFGMAIAVGVLKLIPPIVRENVVLDAPRAYTLAPPLVLMFFAVFGLRAAFQIPTDLDANWVFRLAQPTVREAVRTSRWLILTLAVVPITMIWLLVTLALWSTQTAVAAACLLLVTGMVLTEIALSNWTKIPFASAHEPATETLKSRAAWYLTALLMYQFILSELQARALFSSSTTMTHLGIGAVLVISIRTWRAHSHRKHMATFDVSSSETTTLNLSEALS